MCHLMQAPVNPSERTLERVVVSFAYILCSKITGFFPPENSLVLYSVHVYDTILL
jgi:hypothetical protein